MLLLNRGADIHVSDHWGASLIHRAVESKDFSLVKLLLDRGADIHVRNHIGETPLMYARHVKAGKRILRLLKMAEAEH